MKKLISKLTIGSVVHKATINAPFDEVVEALKKAIENN